MSNAFLAQLPYIGTTTTLGWQNDALAQSYMDHILQRARVLLPRRGWRVGIIKEFYPRGASLLGLNVNAGSEVFVRFRVPGKRNEFLPFHEVLCTALHEFTHCLHSRHDRQFWNAYYDLVKECEALEVTMIQQGKQLYPEAAYGSSQTTLALTPSFLSSSRGARTSHAHGGQNTGVSAFSGRGGHILGGVQRSARRGGGGRRGGGMTTRSRRGTVATTITTRPQKGPKPTPVSPTGQEEKANAMFPGDGHRLGAGGGLRPVDTSPGFTPTRDALRRILAAAAERRRSLSGSRIAPNPTISSSPAGVENIIPQLGDKEVNMTEEVADEGDLPDHVPLSRSVLEDSDDSWKCPRCGFCNEAGIHSCQFCDNDDGDSDAASLTDGEGGEGEPPTKKVCVAATTVTTFGNFSSSPSAASPAPQGTSRDNAVEISDDEDD